MHPYLVDTDYAVRGLFALIGDEGTRSIALHRQLDDVNKELRHANSILHAGAPPSGFGEDTRTYFEKKARDARRQIAELAESVARLQETIDAKSFSIRAIAGAILQVAKQGIVVVHSELSQCPAGRRIGSQDLKDVIWQARNQAMHWEDGEFHPPVTACFQTLEREFGSTFRLDGSQTGSLAKAVIDQLEWTDADSYNRDMISLLG
jgi:hypothetical protein